MDQVATRPADRITGVTFRAATESDIPALQRMYKQLIPDETPSTENMRRTLAEMHADTKGGMVVVGEVSGKVVATCQIIVYGNLVRTPRCKAEIDSVVVEAEYRGRGIGKQMMEWSMNWLSTRNCSKIIVATAYTREVAHEMYSKLGFARSGYGFVYSYPH